jgi:Tat protein translocase TatB subunit
MFGIGMPELLVILVVALVVLGPNRLPELARTLGKAMAEFRRQSTDIMDEFQNQMRVEEDTARRAKVKPPTPTPTPTSTASGGGTPPPSSPA